MRKHEGKWLVVPFEWVEGKQVRMGCRVMLATRTRLGAMWLARRLNGYEQVLTVDRATWMVRNRFKHPELVFGLGAH